MLLKNKAPGTKGKYQTISLAVEPIPEESIYEESIIETSMSGSMPNLPLVQKGSSVDKSPVSYEDSRNKV